MMFHHGRIVRRKSDSRLFSHWGYAGEGFVNSEFKYALLVLDDGYMTMVPIDQFNAEFEDVCSVKGPVIL